MNDGLVMSNMSAYINMSFTAMNCIYPSFGNDFIIMSLIDALPWYELSSLSTLEDSTTLVEDCE